MDHTLIAHTRSHVVLQREGRSRDPLDQAGRIGGKVCAGRPKRVPLGVALVVVQRKAERPGVRGAQQPVAVSALWAAGPSEGCAGGGQAQVQVSPLQSNLVGGQGIHGHTSVCFRGLGSLSDQNSFQKKINIFCSKQGSAMGMYFSSHPNCCRFQVQGTCGELLRRAGRSERAVRQLLPL